MMNQAIILAILSLSASASVLRFPTDRIVGGKPVNIEDVPYQVSINILGYKPYHLCGGSIISERFILSAAHCVVGKNATFTVRSGSNHSESGGQVSQIKKIYSHELFNRATTDYDFTLLELEEPLTFSDTTRPVRLPEADEDIPDGTILNVSGWGKTKNPEESSKYIRIVSVPKVNDESCHESYVTSYLEEPITKQMFCAGYTEGGKDSCQGDSGGPVMGADNVQLGVVSWGKDCAVPGYPGVYAKISAVRDWIREISHV
uniref:trypsin n=1 Tax=Nyssomyia neivai TaxID=330878 RepID=A0A1L8DQI3_9DIPT